MLRGSHSRERLLNLGTHAKEKEKKSQNIRLGVEVMNVKVKFEPKSVVLEGTIIVIDENNEVIYDKEEIFAYKWDEFGELMKLLP